MRHNELRKINNVGKTYYEAGYIHELADIYIADEYTLDSEELAVINAQPVLGPDEIDEKIALISAWYKLPHISIISSTDEIVQHIDKTIERLSTETDPIIFRVLRSDLKLDIYTLEREKNYDCTKYKNILLKIQDK